MAERPERLLAARRQAFVHRIRQVLADICKGANIRFEHSLRWQFEARFESALEDAFQMGMREALKTVVHKTDGLGEPTEEVLP